MKKIVVTVFFVFFLSLERYEFFAWQLHWKKYRTYRKRLACETRCHGQILWASRKSLFFQHKVCLFVFDFNQVYQAQKDDISYTVRSIKPSEIQFTNALDLGMVLWNGRYENIKKTSMDILYVKCYLRVWVWSPAYNKEWIKNAT